MEDIKNDRFKGNALDTKYQNITKLITFVNQITVVSTFLNATKLLQVKEGVAQNLISQLQNIVDESSKGKSVSLKEISQVVTDIEDIFIKEGDDVTPKKKNSYFVPILIAAIAVVIVIAVVAVVIIKKRNSADKTDMSVALV